MLIHMVYWILEVHDGHFLSDTLVHVLSAVPSKYQLSLVLSIGFSVLVLNADFSLSFPPPPPKKKCTFIPLRNIYTYRRFL